MQHSMGLERAKRKELKEKIIKIKNIFNTVINKVNFIQHKYTKNMNCYKKSDYKLILI